MSELGVRRGATLALALVVGIAVGGCGLTASRGTMPPPGPDGAVDARNAPDFIAYAGRSDDIIGWIPKDYLLGPRAGTDDPRPVYANDLSTLIGHDVAGVGFVPIGDSRAPTSAGSDQSPAP